MKSQKLTAAQIQQTSSVTLASQIAKLVIGIQGDDNAAFINFSEIWKICKPIIESVVRVHAFNESDVDDIVQVTFVKCWTQRKSYKKEKGGFLAWLKTIAQNTAIDATRSSRRRDRLYDEFEVIQAIRVQHTDNLHPFEMQDVIITILTKLKRILPPQMFEVVRLKLKGHNLREISKLKGWTHAKTKACSLRLQKGGVRTTYDRIRKQAA